MSAPGRFLQPMNPLVVKTLKLFPQRSPKRWYLYCGKLIPLIKAVRASFFAVLHVQWPFWSVPHNQKHTWIELFVILGDSRRVPEVYEERIHEATFIFEKHSLIFRYTCLNIVFKIWLLIHPVTSITSMEVVYLISWYHDFWNTWYIKK